jgi:hypothetical protein
MGMLAMEARKSTGDGVSKVSYGDCELVSREMVDDLDLEIAGAKALILSAGEAKSDAGLRLDAATDAGGGDGDLEMEDGVGLGEVVVLVLDAGLRSFLCVGE